MKISRIGEIGVVLSAYLLLTCSSGLVAPRKVVSKLPNPAGETEKIQDEKGEFVENTSEEPAFFSAPSSDPTEYFRVIISSDSYKMRQIRGTALIGRKSDPGGDALIIDDVKKFDLIDFKDDGIIVIKLNGDTGKFENINFHMRVPRINDIAKIVQNDATRWTLEHKKGPIPSITKYLIYYNVILKNKSNREEVKDRLKKEVKKN